MYLIMKITETKDFSYVTEAQYCNVTDTQCHRFFHSWMWVVSVDFMTEAADDFMRCAERCIIFEHFFPVLFCQSFTSPTAAIDNTQGLHTDFLKFSGNNFQLWRKYFFPFKELINKVVETFF